MDRSSFIQQYVAVFLASYSADNYVHNCMNGWKDVEQPVEDALLLAEQAWKQIAEHTGKGVTA